MKTDGSISEHGKACGGLARKRGEKRVRGGHVEAITETALQALLLCTSMNVKQK